jgi:phage gp36-like protein
VSSYATLAELATHGLPSGWLTGVSSGDQTAAITAASDLADGYLAQRYTLPITGWGSDLRRVVCHIASWDLMCRRGFDPESSSDVAIRKRYEDAIRWLEMVAAGKISPVGIVDSTPDVDERGPQAYSEEPRGW